MEAIRRRGKQRRYRASCPPFPQVRITAKQVSCEGDDDMEELNEGDAAGHDVKIENKETPGSLTFRVFTGDSEGQ